jgi:hypothetical protein
MNNFRSLQIQNLTKELEDETHRYDELVKKQETEKKDLLKKISFIQKQLDILKNQKDEDTD